mmetsp:Transcript_12782/g.35423  ORF Transcript_12782/g.35423 Transcript_12782/m.35423 type:complete len:213 (+) Transcript_12782:1333-1971(+)
MRVEYRGQLGRFGTQRFDQPHDSRGQHHLAVRLGLGADREFSLRLGAGRAARGAGDDHQVERKRIGFNGRLRKRLGLTGSLPCAACRLHGTQGCRPQPAHADFLRPGAVAAGGAGAHVPVQRPRGDLCGGGQAWGGGGGGRGARYPRGRGGGGDGLPQAARRSARPGDPDRRGRGYLDQLRPCSLTPVARMHWEWGGGQVLAKSRLNPWLGL